MSRKHIISTPIKNQDIDEENLYDEISSDWEEKAKILQIRRWRALKNELKGV